MMAAVCSCGWKLEVMSFAGPANAAVRHETPVMVQHWRSGHTVLAHKRYLEVIVTEAMLLVERENIARASAWTWVHP